MYTCPMHPEHRQNKPGGCPKCGMKLVLSSTLKNSKTNHKKGNEIGPVSWKSYIPLMIIIGLILLTALLTGKYTKDVITNFMIGFFLVFGGFKLLDLEGFAQGYSTYDHLAKRFYAYGFIYPFIELFFGFSMIIFPESRNILLAELIIMTFSGLGVALKLANKEKFQCVCLGTVLKIPLTKVTLIEDFGMAILALLLLTVF